MLGISFRVNDLYTSPGCPFCKGSNESVIELKIESIGHYSNDQMGLVLQSTSEILTQDEHHVKDCVTGKFFFCKSCFQLFFAYKIEDTRRCQNCKFFKYESGFTRGGHCNFFNKDTAEYNHACPKIDSEPIELPSSAACKFCKNLKHSTEKDKHSYCELSCKDEHYFESCIHMQLGPLGGIIGVPEDANPIPCMAYEADLEHYRQYRHEWEMKGNLFDDSIHIPEFDAILEKENK